MHARPFHQLPGPRGAPLVGSTFDVFADPYQFFVDVWRRYGDLVRLRFGPFRYLLVNDPDALRHVFVDHAKNYVKSRTYATFKPLLGDGLITSEGDFYKRQRRLIQPAFHRDRLSGFMETMAAESKKLLDEWRARASIDLSAEMNRLAFRIVGRTLFSADLDGDEVGRSVAVALREALRFIHRNAVSMIQLPVWLPTPRNLRFRRARATLDALVFKIIDEHQSGPKPDVLSLLLLARDEDSGERMSPRQIKDEVMTLVLAGHETTSSLLTWTWLLLSQQPEVVARLRRELDSTLAGRAPSYDDLPHLPYLQAVLQESMRLHPPVWKIERQAVADDVVAGHHIPAGTIIGATMHTLHRHERHWPDPDRFDPERFLDERAATRAKHAYLPFGAGPRLCIGNNFALVEAQVILAMMLRRVDIFVERPELVVQEPAVTLHPRGEVPARIRFIA